MNKLAYKRAIAVATTLHAAIESGSGEAYAVDLPDNLKEFEDLTGALAYLFNTVADMLSGPTYDEKIAQLVDLLKAAGLMD